MNHCKFCGKEIPDFKFESKKHRRVTCSLSCSAKLMHSDPERARRRVEKISVAFKRLHREHPEWAERVRQQWAKCHPMHDPIQKAKILQRIKEIGHKPRIHGGNGTGPTPAELKLLENFEKAKNNYVVRTGMKMGSGYPQHYKVDVAFPDIRLAVEADGGSHQSILAQFRDRKKDNLLAGLGWIVLRYKNKRILEETDAVVAELQSIISKLRGTLPIASTDSLHTIAV